MKGIVFSLGKNKSEHSRIKQEYKSFRYFIRRYGKKALFSLFVIFGLVLGLIFCSANRLSPFLEGIRSFWGYDVCMLPDASFLQVLMANISPVFIFTVFIYLFSTSPLGVILVPSAAFFKGFSSSVIIFTLVSANSFKGALFYFINFLPGELLLFLTVVMFGEQAFDNSKLVLTKSFIKKDVSVYSDSFRKITICGLYAFIPATAAVVLNTIMRMAFAKYFGII